MIYFDNAATTFPKPANVPKAVYDALVKYGANPGRSGHALSLETARQVYQARSKIAAFFGTDNPDHVVFTQNCTYALNTVLKGLFKPGDHVILSDLEHNSVLRPVHALAKNGGIHYSIAQTSFDDEETIAAFRAQIRPDTRAIITTHASNVFGLKLPIEKLAALAKENQLYFIVDAAQTAGAEPIHVTDMGIDFLCTAGHKGLYGPTGTGLLITKHGQRLRPLVEGGTGSVSSDSNQPDFMPDRLEAGTVNIAGIIGLGAGVDFVSKKTVQKIASQEMRIAQFIYEGLTQIKSVQLYTPAPHPGVNMPVISFNIGGLNSEQTTGALDGFGFALRGGLHCAPIAHKKLGTSKTGTARISIGAFNTLKQGFGLVQAVAKIAHAAKKEKTII